MLWELMQKVKVSAYAIRIICPSEAEFVEGDMNSF